MRARSLTALVFGTSAAVLVLEILAGRLLAPYVGESLETYTGVIGTVLAGIAAGSELGGRLSDRYDPRRLVGPTLVLGGALGWLSLPIIATPGPSAADGVGAIVVLTGCAFFLPAAVLSAVSPMAAKLRLQTLSETGAVVGGLSAAGTAGALVGTFVTGFVLVAIVPLQATVLALGAALVVTGAALWWRLAPGSLSSGTVAVWVVAGVAGAGGLGLVADRPCQTDTAYYCVRIEVDPDRASGRILHLDDLRHSYVDLEDPTHLEFRYVRLFADVVAAVSEPGDPVDTLHVGGGGFTFPRYLTETRPGSTNLVLEIDPELVEIARESLGLELGPDLRVDTGDARLALEDLPGGAFDVVVGDAFGGLAVPWHLTTEEIVADIARVLRPNGIYVINVIDRGSDRFARAELGTLAGGVALGSISRRR